MAFAQLEDFSGSIELILFSDVYESRRALIANDAIVGVQGKIDTTRGDAKVKVDDIMEPGALPQRPAQAVHVRLRDEVGTEESLHEMREYLLDRRGSCSLFFHVGSGQRRRGDRGAGLVADPGRRFRGGPRRPSRVPAGGRRMDRVRIGLVGFGTVGESFYRLLTRNAEEFARRLGVAVEVPWVGVRDASRPRSVGPGTRVVQGWREILDDPIVPIVVELAGGVEAPLPLIREALARGKHVITANKALLSAHGRELFALAAANGRGAEVRGGRLRRHPDHQGPAARASWETG